MSKNKGHSVDLKRHVTSIFFSKGPLENVWEEGAGGGQSTKKIFK